MSKSMTVLRNGRCVRSEFLIFLSPVNNFMSAPQPDIGVSFFPPQAQLGSILSAGLWAVTQVFGVDYATVSSR
jgi:hypothetical protein